MDRQTIFPQVIKWAVVCAFIACASFLAPSPIHAGLCTITITPGPPPTPVPLPGGTTGVAYSQTFTGTGCSPPYTFVVTAGSPPPGLTLQSATATTIKLAGTPTSAGT